MIFLTALAALYFLPTIIAHNRGHRVAGVLLLNLLVGWTGVGWVALLLWSLLSWAPYSVDGPPVAHYRPGVYYYHPPVYYYPPNYCPPNTDRG
jgi:Superinfection immunity protein